FACSARAEGIAIYDVETMSMRSLLLVFSGTVWRGKAPEQGRRETGGVVEWTLEPSAEASAHGLDVMEIGESPSQKVGIVSPGAYKAVMYQEAGGGIMEFYDLVQDPDAKWNLAGWDRGLFEVGWHGATFESPGDKKDCCLKHILEQNRDGQCYDGTRDWP